MEYGQSVQGGGGGGKLRRGSVVGGWKDLKKEPEMETTRMMGMEYRRRWGPYVERLVSEYTALHLIYRGDGG